MVGEGGEVAVPSPALYGLSGAFSGVVSLAIMYPLDNIRTRMQVRGGLCGTHPTFPPWQQHVTYPSLVS